MSTTNYLIKKLGGYTAEEMREASDRERKLATCYKTACEVRYAALEESQMLATKLSGVAMELDLLKLEKLADASAQVPNPKPRRASPQHVGDQASLARIMSRYPSSNFSHLFFSGTGIPHERVVAALSRMRHAGLVTDGQINGHVMLTRAGRDYAICAAAKPNAKKIHVPKPKEAGHVVAS